MDMDNGGGPISVGCYARAAGLGTSVLFWVPAETRFGFGAAANAFEMGGIDLG